MAGDQEDLTEGDYAPSPGIVYPTLTMLEDMGHIREQKSKDSKKVFEATDEGRAHLEDNAEDFNAVFLALLHEFTVIDKAVETEARVDECERFLLQVR